MVSHSPKSKPKKVARVIPWGVGLLMLASLLGNGWQSFQFLRSQSQFRRALAEAQKANQGSTELAQSEQAQKEDAQAQLKQLQASEQRVIHQWNQTVAELQNANHSLQESEALLKFLQENFLPHPTGLRSPGAEDLRNKISPETAPHPSMQDLLLSAADKLAPSTIEKSLGAQPLLQARMMYLLATSLLNVGQPNKAIELLKPCLALRIQEHGLLHANTIQTQKMLAAAYLASGNPKQALPLLQEAIESERKADGVDDLTKAKTLRDLACAYLDAGEAIQAADRLQSALQIQQAKLEAGHDDRLATQRLLARAYLDQGNYIKAIPLLETTLAEHTTRFGSKDLGTSESEFELGKAYLDAGNVIPALRLLNKVRDDRVARLGPSHSLAKESIRQAALARLEYERPVNLAEPSYLIENQIWDLRSPSEALAVLQSRELHQELTDEESAYIRHQKDIAAALRIATKDNEAEETLQHLILVQRKLCENAIRAVGESDPKTISCKRNLAQTMLDVYRSDEAAELFQVVYDFGKKNPHLFSTRRLIEDQLAMGIAQLQSPQPTNRDLSFETLKSAYERAQAHFGESHQLTIKSLHSWGRAHLETQADPGSDWEARVFRGIDYMERAYALAKSNLGPFHLQTLAAGYFLSKAYERRIDFAAIEGTLCELHKQTIAKFGDDHPNSLMAKRELARLQTFNLSTEMTSVEVEKSIRTWSDLEKQVARLYEPTHPLVIDCIDKQILIYKLDARPHLALALIERKHQLLAQRAQDEAKNQEGRPPPSGGMPELVEARLEAGLTMNLLELAKSFPQPDSSSRFIDQFEVRRAYDLADAYWRTGNLKQAAPLAEQVLKFANQSGASPSYDELTYYRLPLQIVHSRGELTLKRREQMIENWRKQAAQMRYLMEVTNQFSRGTEFLADAHLGDGNIDLAVRVWEERLSQIKSNDRHDSPKVFQMAATLAKAYRLRGKDESAAPLLQSIREHLHALAEPPKQEWQVNEHWIAADSSLNLSVQRPFLRDCISLFELDSIHPLLEKYQARLKARCGEKHPNYLIFEQLMVDAQQEAGNHQLAIQIAEPLLEIRKEILGPEYPETLETMHTLASLYLAGSQLEKAISLCRETIALRARVLGPIHPKTLDSMDVLAAAQAASQQFAETEATSRAILSIRMEQSPHSWETSHSKTRVGAALVFQNDLTEPKRLEGKGLLVEGYKGLKTKYPQLYLQNKHYVIEDSLQLLLTLPEPYRTEAEAKSWKEESEVFQTTKGKLAKVR